MLEPNRICRLMDCQDTLYFDPASGKLQTSRPEPTDNLYYDPATGKLQTSRPEPRNNLSESQRGLGLQGSGLKNAGLQGSKAKISGLYGSTSYALGLRAPLWSIFSAKSNSQIKKSAIPINFYTQAASYITSYYLKVD